MSQTKSLSISKTFTFWQLDRLLAVLTAIGLAACAWPGSNFYRTAVTNVSLPAHLQKTRTSWQSQHVMSYVPGGSAQLAQGHVTDWKDLVRRLYEARTAGGASVAARIWELLDARDRVTFEKAATGGSLAPNRVSNLTRALNKVLHSPDLYSPEAFRDVALNATAERLLEQAPGGLPDRELTKLNRALLVSAMPDLVLPPPAGQGVLVTTDPGDSFVLDTLLEGRPEDEKLALTELPWSAWWPTIRLWGGLALLLGIASLCLALIVHPQWSQRELLPYPIARFVEEATARTERAWLPNVAKTKLFWIALTLVFAIRLLNGFSAWFDVIPAFPMTWNFVPLRELFPTAARVPMGWGVWRISLFPTVIAFAFFLNTRVAFSLGIANFAWVFFGSILIANGIPVTYQYVGGEKINLLRFGSFVGMGVILVYTGRRYYANVLASSFGFGRARETPGYAVWAGRGFLLSTVFAIMLLSTGGVSPLWSSICVLFMLLTFVVLSRIVAETGAFFLQTYWVPVGVITALFGIEAIGPTAFVVLGVASIVLIGDPRTALMPYLNTALRMTETTARTSPRRIAPWLLGMIVGGFLIAGAVTMYTQYNLGINYHDGWATQALPEMPFNHLSNHTSELASKGILNQATARTGLDSLASFSPEEGAYLWVGIGLAFVLLAAFARLRLPWWPFHPVLFLVWATYPILQFGGSFLLGWAVKAAVVKTMGAKGYHGLKPLMIGLIAGDLLGGLLWIIVGVWYYFQTGQPPARYAIFPG